MFAEYPDARVIHTHRDPRKFIASLVSLLAVLRFTRSDHVDVAALGPMMELTYQMFLEQVIAQRATARFPTNASSTVTSSTSWPIRSARCTSCTNSSSSRGPSGHDRVVTDYLAAKPKGKHGAHAYTFADVGLDEDHVRATFAGYVAHYGITEE